ncbi:MAG: 50S ribosomal protein L6, partial [Clostridia bacterium]|nr:50S ribosomal protein L6 [Clostridia bacterium]
MSRIGKQPIAIPAGVEVELKEGNTVTVKGPKGEMTRSFHPTMQISKEDGKVLISRPSDDKFERSLHGLTRSLLHNMVDGVTKGFSKKLEITGVGYRAQLQGTTLVLHLGYSHSIEMIPPEGIKIEVPDQNHITVSGCDKQ